MCHTDGADLGAHITPMREAWAKMKGQGGKVTDNDFRLIVIASMPKEWNIYLSTLNTYKTSAEVIAKLHSHDALLACDRKPAIIQTKALATSRNMHSHPGVICSKPVCGKPGHTIDKCFNLAVEWQVNTWTGGRKRGDLLAIHHHHHNHL